MIRKVCLYCYSAALLVVAGFAAGLIRYNSGGLPDEVQKLMLVTMFLVVVVLSILGYFMVRDFQLANTLFKVFSACFSLGLLLFIVSAQTSLALLGAGLCLFTLHLLRRVRHEEGAEFWIGAFSAVSIFWMLITALWVVACDENYGVLLLSGIVLFAGGAIGFGFIRRHDIPTALSTEVPAS